MLSWMQAGSHFLTLFGTLFKTFFGTFSGSLFKHFSGTLFSGTLFFDILSDTFYVTAAC